MNAARTIAALAYAGAAFFFGVALGERGELGFVQTIFTIAIPLITLVLTWFARRARAEVLAAGTAMLIGLVSGQQAFAHAFATCANDAAPIRDAVIDYRTRTGDYPPRLESLHAKLPCRCILRKTILHYAQNERGFRLWFTDDVTVGVPRPAAAPPGS
ncbi:MAG TPA: hypothetical protein VFN10_07605 [Thermoanaerobaculia bacterium]|nr:hypothetical protein [Thermoanaerobaculia bacterium]